MLLERGELVYRWLDLTGLEDVLAAAQMSHTRVLYLCKLLCLWNRRIDFLGEVFLGFGQNLAGHRGPCCFALVGWWGSKVALREW